MTCAQSCLIRSRATASFRVIITTLQSCSIRKDKSLSFPSTIIIIADFARPGPIAEANSKPSTDPSKLRMLSSGRVMLGIILTFLFLFTFMSHFISIYDLHERDITSFLLRTKFQFTISYLVKGCST